MGLRFDDVYYFYPELFGIMSLRDIDVNLADLNPVGEALTGFGTLSGLAGC